MKTGQPALGNFMKQIETIGIIGFGRFSRLMIHYLSRDFTVIVFDRRDRKEAIGEAGGRSRSLTDVCQCDVVVPAVPISAMPEMLQQIAPLLAQRSLVVDICSVKTLPVQWMTKWLPKQTAFLATHPMFGPDSANKTLAGQKMILCRQRIDNERYNCIRDYLKSNELVVIETTPEDHDRQMAATLALTHFIGRALDRYGAKPLAIDTEGYKRLLYTLETVTHDTWELFMDMHHYNPYAKEIRSQFKSAVEEVDALIEIEAINPEGPSK